MPTYDEALSVFKKEMDDMGISYHEDLYHAICKHLGPSIHDDDASKVACSDPKELATVKNSFLIGKLGLKDGPELDKAIEEVCGGLGHSNTNKHRATFYYLLVAVLKQESHFI
jgi:hypothetical protein